MTKVWGQNRKETISMTARAGLVKILGQSKIHDKTASWASAVKDFALVL